MHLPPIRSMALLLSAVFLAISALGGFAAKPVYGFDPRANELLGILLPLAVMPSSLSQAAADPKGEKSFKSLEDVLDYHVVGNNPATQKAVPLQIGDDYLESYWLSLDLDDPQAVNLLRGENSSRLIVLLSALSGEKLRFASTLEKAMFQRDVYQLFYIICRLGEFQKDEDLKRSGRALMQSIAILWRQLLLTPSEFKSLAGMLPRTIDSTGFVVTNRFNLTDNYLPERVVRSHAEWYQFPFSPGAIKHFRDFGGRSFIRIFAKSPGQSNYQFEDYWKRTYAIHGEHATAHSNVLPLPAGTETMLIRTWSVFLTDDSAADSGFPEEVILRIFKYQKQTLDLTTSDYRGTLFYQYKMQRRKLLGNPDSLGLVRVREVSPQFFGFFSEVPDPQNATSKMLTTMRFNCIGCHSELLYGSATVFSLAAAPPANPTSLDACAEPLEPLEGRSRVRLKTKEYLILQEHLLALNLNKQK